MVDIYLGLQTFCQDGLPSIFNLCLKVKMPLVYALQFPECRAAWS